MPLLDGYDHAAGRHCGAAALRNVAEYYHWGYDEATCFGYGAGLGFAYVDPPDREYPLVRPTTPWLESSFFETLELPATERSGDDWESAWENVVGRVDDDAPVLTFLDPAALPYLSTPVHDEPHAALVVGYEGDAVHLSDGSRDALQTVSLDAFHDAWATGDEDHRYLVVTNPESRAAPEPVATTVLHDVAEYMVHPLDADRAVGGPGDEGLPALRTFAADVAEWGDLEDDEARAVVDDALANLDWHGTEAAFRDLYADALDELAGDAGLSRDVVGKCRDVAAQWRTITTGLDDVATADADERPAVATEVSTLLTQAADREEGLFREILEAL